MDRHNIQWWRKAALERCDWNMRGTYRKTC